MQSFATLGHAGQVRRLKRLAGVALAQYPPAFGHLAPLTHEENTTFRAEDATGARYVLRISRPGKHTLEEVRSEVAWLAALRRDTGLGVPEPVPTRDGDLAILVAGEGVPEARICALFRWVEGRFVNAGLTPQHSAQVGAFAARMHEHVAGFVPPAGFTRGRLAAVDPAWEADTLGRVAAVRSPADVATLQAVIAHIRAALAPLGQEPDTHGLIHGDLHQWNYLFHRGAMRAIDFDDCGFGPFLYDLSVPLYELEDHPRFPAMRAALLAGYRRVRPLPAAHEAILPALLLRRRIDILMWNLDSREHPAFRDRWAAHVTYDLGRLRELLPA